MIFLFFILMLVFTVLENYYRERERFNPDKNSGAIWHLTQLCALIIAFGYVVIEKYGFTLYAYSILFLMGAVWFICFDGGLNLFRGFYFFKQSTQSTDPFKNLGKPAIKIALLLISLALFIYFAIK